MFYLCIIVYLYGDLAIYAAAVPLSLMEVSWWVPPSPPESHWTEDNNASGL